MTTLSGPLTTGALLPAVQLVSPEEAPTTLANLLPATNALVYFMRTSTCPMCHQHVSNIERLVAASTVDPASVVVIVPGGAREAGDVERRHPALAGRVFASSEAHERVGLFVKMGMQQSGTYVTSSEGNVLYSKTATVPMGTFDERAVLAHLS